MKLYSQLNGALVRRSNDNKSMAKNACWFAWVCNFSMYCAQLARSSSASLSVFCIVALANFK